MWGVTLIVGAGRRPVEAEGGDMRMDSTADCLCSLGPVRDCRQALDKELREQEFSLVMYLITSHSVPRPLRRIGAIFAIINTHLAGIAVSRGFHWTEY